MSTASSTPDFWIRIGLKECDRLRCMSIVQRRYFGCKVQEFKEQGYCSLTLLVTAPDAIESSSHEDGNVSRKIDWGTSRSLIVQLRPAQHALDIGIARAAREAYSSLAPSTHQLNLTLPGQLCMYEMERMPGTSLSRLLPRSLSTDSILQKKEERLIESLARFMAQSWQSVAERPNSARTARADSPMEDLSATLSRCTGSVGLSVVQRLEKLGRELPDELLKEKAKATLACIKALTNYPVVLNHGDMIPSNILVDEDTWEVTGLVDWAEAEYLPFGTCLYGLEHFLGYLKPLTEDLALACKESPSFVYYAHATRLRERFWTRLLDLVPELKTRQEDLKTVRDLGVLLWYGYAWDDGAINRVVNETEDAVEVACLRAFLAVT
ncbi:hypothetical protein BDU57DRAFT_519691 [Ampelomyces quisqualis]|uniref:Aminoglycoside phosphotransferase domain-containing protein n=1 Tax=Ampelomyces quisqualis TaxID=50730 RepID=A0A6A5QIT2_AMPQU|nr:hypothetical protein BDU57DRAFT_519691 [Ampelomyces quisqualis]